jgi:WD40 repeat protein
MTNACASTAILMGSKLVSMHSGLHKASTTVMRMHMPPGKVKIWEVATGRCLRTLEGPDEGITWLQWHPRGAVLVAGSEDFTAWMWNTDSGQCMQVAAGVIHPAKADIATCALHLVSC